MDQAKPEDHRQSVRWLDSDTSPKTVKVVKALVDHRYGDHGIDEVVVRLNTKERRPEQRNAVANRERGDEFYDVPEPRQEEHHAKQEEQVVVARQHVDGARPCVVEMAAVSQGAALMLRHGVRERRACHGDAADDAYRLADGVLSGQWALESGRALDAGAAASWFLLISTKNASLPSSKTGNRASKAMAISFPPIPRKPPTSITTPMTRPVVSTSRSLIVPTFCLSGPWTARPRYSVASSVVLGF